MDQFCHSVSHDLKSPIQVMHQLLELLSAILKESANPLPEDADEVMERLFHKCSQAEAMIMRLLDFSRMTQLPCRPVPVDPEKIIRNAYNDLVLLEEGRIIHLTIEKLPSVCGDPVLLSQLDVYKRQALPAPPEPAGPWRRQTPDFERASRIRAAPSGRSRT